jgi:hypothetical protein
MARMKGIVVLVFPLVLGPVAEFFGADSKLPDGRRSVK